MKKILFGSVILSVIFISCLKNADTKCSFNDSSATASSTEIADMQTYLNSQSITGTTQHSSGFFYKINAVGTGTAVSNLCTTVTVRYKGRLTNGTIFDSTATGAAVSFQLGQVIPGWQKGVPLIAKGGSITLYIPPSLGYGATPVTNQTTGAVIIPANSKLIFNIDLVDVTN